MEIANAVISTVAEELASELGISVPGGALGKCACSFISTEALRATLDVLVPTASAGISFSATGITLALIQKKLRDINKSLDKLLDAQMKTAKDKLSEAINALECENFIDAYEDFKKAGEHAIEGYHTCNDNEKRLTCVRIRLFSLIMTKSFDNDRNTFMPFRKLNPIKKKEVAQLLQATLDNFLTDVGNESSRFNIANTFMPGFKNKHKEFQSNLNQTLINLYPILSDGLEWSNPNGIIHEDSDIVRIQIHPKYVPVGNDPPLKLCIGVSADRKEMSRNVPLTVSVYRADKKSSGDKLEQIFVENVKFLIDDSLDQFVNIPFFKGKKVPFQGDNEVFLSAATSGAADILQSVVERNPNFDVNCKNFKGDFALKLAIQNQHLEIVEILVKMGKLNLMETDLKGNTALHEAAIQGDKASIKILFSVLSINAINKQNLEGATPLYLAALNGHAGAVQLLIDGGANVDRPFKDGSSPLLVACAKGNEDVTEILLKSQANPVARAIGGDTPLTVATAAGHAKIVKKLLRKMSKADIGTMRRISVDIGMSPAEMATQNGHKQIAETLKKSGLG